MTIASRTGESRALSFSNDLIRAQVVDDARDYPVDGAVVVNLSSNPIEAGGEVPGIVPPWRSTFLTGGKILAAERVAIVSVSGPWNLGGLPLLGWRWYGDLNKNFGRNLPLYISPQDSVGHAEVDPWFLTNQVRTEGERLEFEIKLNLWWAPPETDCSIHIEHPFLELHSQIFGVGRMQKFHERDAATLYENICMAPGMTHEPFARMIGERSWTYPWHRYYADTSCVWLAIEFHRTSW
jgi:hypothetical protein